MIALRYIALDTSQFKPDQLEKINRILFGSLNSLECEINSPQVQPTFFDPIVNGLKSQSRQLKSFIFRNTASNLTTTLKSIDCVTSQLTELSINTTHVNFKEYDLSGYIKDRSKTLELLTLSLFYDKIASVGFYEKTMNCQYPKLRALEFGTLDYTHELDWSLINKTNFPMLTDVGFYWNSSSRQLDIEYQTKFIDCLSHFKRIHTTLNLSPLILEQMPTNSNVEKWKLRIFSRFKSISFNPVVKTIAITFTQKFNQESSSDENDEFMISLFNSLMHLRLDYLSLWNIKTNFIPLLMAYLDSEAAQSLTYFGFSIPTQTNISFNFTPLIEILAKLPCLYTLEFTDISSPEHVEQIERITQLSKSVEKLTFIHSSTLHEPTGMKESDKYSVSYGGSTKQTNNAFTSPTEATTTSSSSSKSSGFCKTQ
ncbi:hypothetical protein PPL_04097 [Heterostelium album PN500]|uniref:Uncharacterized protein n=1 Tax=Heterostelium pallidum (strain ATCC 26659 / Pp 5 / PN500) TaxID=670386 RepID=D3B609_HETP5|nr:hypothetical protein PPL_04097 [Heterostelium album PN500]EFA83307.1 hypothetical protein PPL_04097 [Heterostelium album PN500]|eukprot:XP_020435424.1 hypothetical protein PPL_04097 [Heterostelium album PN500]